ncbi:hypothetical protein HanRHA438_Chr17g0807611 [Helianthus annuus]|nr:hypothetical protein HanRHA438_Chr17g0807611 [Helianthus annuus]
MSTHITFPFQYPKKTNPNPNLNLPCYDYPHHQPSQHPHLQLNPTHSNPVHPPNHSSPP